MSVVKVGIAEVAFADRRSRELVTYALGSCIGLVGWDRQRVVGGLLHLMLPLSKIAPEKAAATPAMFADTGIPLLFEGLFQRGGRLATMEVHMYGGASLFRGRTGAFDIGSRNIGVVRKVLAHNGVRLASEDVGGSVSRTVTLDVRTGQVTVRRRGTTGSRS